MSMNLFFLSFFLSLKDLKTFLPEKLSERFNVSVIEGITEAINKEFCVTMSYQEVFDLIYRDVSDVSLSERGSLPVVEMAVFGESFESKKRKEGSRDALIVLSSVVFGVMFGFANSSTGSFDLLSGLVGATCCGIAGGFLTQAIGSLEKKVNTPAAVRQAVIDNMELSAQEDSVYPVRFRSQKFPDTSLKFV